MTNSNINANPGNAGPPQIPSPPKWYWTARRMAEKKADAVKNMNKGIDRSIDHFSRKQDTMQKALGLTRESDVQKRLLFYYNKPPTWAHAMQLFQQGYIKVPYSWESQKAYFPRDYEEDWADFQKLRERAKKGDFGPVMQAEEIAYVEPSFGQVPPQVYQGPGGPSPTTTPGAPEPNVRLAQPPRS